MSQYLSEGIPLASIKILTQNLFRRWLLSTARVTRDTCATNITGWVTWTVSGQALAAGSVSGSSQRALSHYRDNRPCFNRCHGLSDRRVLFHVDRTIDGAVPNRWFVGPVHHVYLDLNCPRQYSVPPVLSNGFQSVALSLGVNNKVRMLV